MDKNVRKERFTGAAHHHPFYLGFLLIFLCTALAPAVSMAVIPQVSAGDAHSVALKSDGTVWTWGDNLVYQLGYGTAQSQSSLAQQVTGISGIVEIAAGEDHTLALDSSGNVWAWGGDAYNQLGDDNTIPDQVIPFKIPGLPIITAIAAGTQFSMALDKNGAVWAWGLVLGDGTNSTVSVQTPTQITALSGIKWIAAGAYHAIATDGTTVWAWGSNSNGQLGNNSTTDSTSPVPVTNLTGVINVAAGAYHSLALKSNGTVVAWGKNFSGQLGDGNNNDSYVPELVNGLHSVTGIAAGYSHSVALDSSGELWAWGNNSSGELGNSNITASNVPVTTFSTATPADATPAGSCSAGSLFTLAIKGDGTVWASGVNDDGQLGNGNTSDISIPNPTPLEVLSLNLVSSPSTCPATGDVNGDGSVDIFDVIKALDFAAGLNLATASPVATANADMNCDGVIDIFDVIKILIKASK